MGGVPDGVGREVTVGVWVSVAVGEGLNVGVTVGLGVKLGVSVGVREGVCDGEIGVFVGGMSVFVGDNGVSVGGIGVGRTGVLVAEGNAVGVARTDAISFSRGVEVFFASVCVATIRPLSVALAEGVKVGTTGVLVLVAGTVCGVTVPAASDGVGVGMPPKLIRPNSPKRGVWRARFTNRKSATPIPRTMGRIHLERED